MSEHEFMGLLIKIGLPMIGTLAGLIVPVLKLNTTLTQLTERLDRILEHNKSQDEILARQEVELKKLIERDSQHEVRFENHEKRLEVLEKCSKCGGE